jgi:hypothetical protein
MTEKHFMLVSINSYLVRQKKISVIGSQNILDIKEKRDAKTIVFLFNSKILFLLITDQFTFLRQQ